MTTNQSDFMQDSSKIWEEIKDVELNLFGLPGQIVKEYCSVVNVEPSKLYLTSKVSAVLPALEEALMKSYTVESQMKWIVISRKV